MDTRNSKSIALATRASSRIKPGATRPQPSRTTRATKAKEVVDPSLDTPKVPIPANPPARVPLWNRENGARTPVPKKKPTAAKPKATKAPIVADVTACIDHQPIKAFLRVRSPASKEVSTVPYLTPTSDTSVKMTDPSPSNLGLQSASVQTTYTFSKVFPPETKQAEFFVSTALPLVRDLLEGQNGLLFAYGVTNSGKTYTIQGGAGEGEAGLLPRTLDVIFNSIEGLHSDAPFRPVRLGGVEIERIEDSSARSSLDAFRTAQRPINLTPDLDENVLASVIAEQIAPLDRDETALQVDKNYEYSVWVSYAEVYNEKVFDLLGYVSSDNAKATIGGLPPHLEALANAAKDLNNPLLVKRKALNLKNDPDGGKYIAGLREVRVCNADEAQAVVKLGQINRRVFGTLANHASSRSHGIFTVKLIKIHKGCLNDPDAAQTARLSIVDLAGSERANNTQNTGERLKEAGNINKSLMVLGQCMEALRINQKRLANAPLTDPLNVKLTLVPFRHSKLTELFQDFFVGNGKAVMIVNVNPFDTGFDENMHVMKFAALAKNVTTVQKAPLSSGIPRLAANATHRRVTLSLGSKMGGRVTETHLDVLEEDEEYEEEDHDSEPNNPLVEALFEYIEELRIRLFEAEMRSATVESETRDEVIKEMEERMTQMERMYTRRLRNELEENQLKIDRKIDMLHQAGLIGGQAMQARGDLADLEEELDVEDSLVMEDDRDEEGPSITFSTADHSLPTPSTSSIFNTDYSPLARKKNSIVINDSDISGPIGLFAEGSEEEAESSASSSLEDIDAVSTSDVNTSQDVGTTDSESDYSHGARATRSHSTSLHRPRHSEGPSSQLTTVKKSTRQFAQRMSSPVSPLHRMRIGTGSSNDTSFDDILNPERIDNGPDSIVIIPDKKACKAAMGHAGPDTMYVPLPGSVDEKPKKKKRILGKKMIVTEEEIDAVTNQAAKVGLNGGNVRRLATRTSKR